MSKFWKLFSKVFHTYTLEEKVISVVALGLILFVAVQSVVSYFRSPNNIFERGVYTEALVSEYPILINPLYTDFNQVNREVSSLIFSGLTKYDPQTKNFVDDLATLNISEDKKTYTFTLKDNLLWHDGKPLTAEDVIFTYGIIQNPLFKNPILKANFDQVKIEKIDDKNIKFTLNNPNAFFITNLNVGILPKHLLGEVHVENLPIDEFNLKPVGSGPYKIDTKVDIQGDGRQKLKLFANEKYFAEKPTIKEIRFNIYPDDETLLKDKDSINIVSKLNPSFVSEFEKDTRFRFTQYTLPQYTAVFFNTGAGFLKIDQSKKGDKLRIGLLKSIDKDELLKLLPNRMRVDTPLMELNQNEWIYKPNVDEANGAFFDAGYNFPKDKEGNRLPNEAYRKDKDGKVLELQLIARKYEDTTYLAEEIKIVTDFLSKSWEKNGVKLNVTLLDEPEFLAAIQSRSYDMILTGQSMRYNLDTFPFWHSSQADSTGLNLSQYKSFAADQLIEKIRSTFDNAEKDKWVNQLAKVIADDVPAIFLYRPQYIFAADDKVKNIGLEGLAYPNDRFTHLAKWCIECK